MRGWIKELSFKNPRMQLSVCIALLLCCIGVFLLSKQRSPSIVYFNLKQTEQLFLTQTLKAHLSPKQQTVLAKDFANTLKTSVNDYANTHHAIVLTSGAVISGGKDVTPLLEKVIAMQMKQRAAKRAQVHEHKERRT